MFSCSIQMQHWRRHASFFHSDIKYLKESDIDLLPRNLCCSAECIYDEADT